MDVLPRFIKVLDATGRPCEPRRRLRRVDPGGRSEADWDRILTKNVELLADALREAEMIAEDSTLMYLGAQVDNIDLLPAHPDLERTAKPRKSLEYGLTLDDDSGAVFKIHFGGYEKTCGPRSRWVSCSGPTTPRAAMPGGGASRP
jgi:hypothetical protein